MSKIRGNAAIVGTAESDLGAVAPDMSPVDLIADHKSCSHCTTDA